MKKILLLLLTMLTCTTLYVRAWEKPSAASLAHADQISATEGGDSTFYYLYNVGGDGFLSNAVCADHAPWTTHAALLEEGRKIIVEKYCITDPETQAQTWDGKTWNISDDFNGSWLYVFPTSDYMMFVDWGGQADHMWEIIAKGDGIFNIKVADVNPEFNDASKGYTTYMGFNAYDVDYINDNTVKPLTPMLDPTNSHVEYDTDAKIDWMFVTEEAYNAYAVALTTYYSAVSLGQLIQEAQLLVDVTEAKAVYDNANSTKEQLDEAYAVLKEKYRLANISALLEGASETSPRDATSFILNAAFDEGVQWEQPPYWTVEAMGTNNCFQNNSIYTGDGGITLNQFMESWIDSGNDGHLKDGGMYQILSGLPAGRYVLACDAMTNNQANTTMEITGVELFATGGSVTTTATVSTRFTSPQHFTLSFISSGGDLKLGLRTNSTNANWIAADNFTLWYYGPITKDPYQIILEELVAECEKTYPVMSEVKAEQTIKESYAEELEKAKNTTEGFEDEITALKAATEALRVSVSEYEKLKKTIASLEDKAGKYEEKYPDLSADLGDLSMDLTDMYNDGSATSEYIASLDKTIHEIILKDIVPAMQSGDDISIMIENPDFDDDVAGWISDGANLTFGGKGSTGGKNQIGEVEVMTSGNAEVWFKAFDAHQIITGLPQGSYTLTCKAYERHDNEDYQNNYDPELPREGMYAKLYANDYETTIVNIMSGAQAERVFQGTTGGQDYQTTFGWIPNTMDAANFFFAVSPDTYLNTVTFVLTEESNTVQFGVKTEFQQSWLIFDQFRLTYNGNDASVYADLMAQLLGSIQDMLDGQTVIGADATKKLQASVALLNDAKDTKACIAAINDARASYEYATTSASLYASLSSEYVTLAQMVEKYYDTASAAALQKAIGLIEVIDAVLTNKNKTNDEIPALMVDIMKSEREIMFPDLDKASETNPVDVSSVIVNGTFDVVGNFDGWSGTSFGAGGTTSSCAEHYEKNFDTYQDILGLPAGKYLAYVQGYYRRGTVSDDWAMEHSENPDTARYAKFYAVSSADSVSVPVATYTSGRATEAPGGQGEYVSGYYMPNSMLAATRWFNALDENGNEYYTNTLTVNVADDSQLRLGVKKDIYAGSGEWAVFDNFRLYYLGGGSTDIQAPSTGSGSVQAGIYNLAGQRLAAPQKGINIINGRKYLLK